jgi:hypothetical protein
MIIITDSFEKILLKIKSVWIDEIRQEIYKHKNWLNNFKLIWTIKGRKVLKGYMLSKKIRIVVLFKESNWYYLPFYIAKKETKDWYNISKYSLQDLNDRLVIIFEDLENWKFRIID